MRKLLRLIPIRQLVGYNLLNAPPILPIQYIIVAISMAIHIMRPYIPSDLRILIQSLQFLSFRITIIFQCYGIVW